MFVCVCLPTRLLKIICIKSSMNNQSYKSYCLSVSLCGTCYIDTIVGQGLSNKACHELPPKKSKVML